MDQTADERRSENDATERVTPTIPPDASERYLAIFNAIKEFSESDLIELPLPQFSNTRARTIAHEVADLFGLYHRSDGRGKDRFVTIRKTVPPTTSGRYNPETQTWEEYNFDESLISKITSNNQIKLKCLTFNVLYDPPDKRAADQIDYTFTSIRTPLIFEFLSKSDADIITLNEVSHEFFESIKQQTWLQNCYFITSMDSEFLSPGNLILSKFPIKTSFVHQLKLSHKAVNIAELYIPGTEPSSIWLATAHLKAGPVATFARMRYAQTKEMIEQLRYLAPEGQWLVMGDLNIRSFEKEEIPHLNSTFLDVWTHFNSNDSDGFTYDPWNNTLAEFASSRISSLESTRVKMANRYDRILIRSKNALWKPTGISILAKEPLGEFPNKTPLYLSDHFALEAEFSSSA